MRTRRTSEPKRATATFHRVSDAFDVVSGMADALLQRAFAGRVAYDSVSWEDILRDLEDIFGGDATEVLAEPALREMEERTRNLLEEIRPVDPFRRVWAADSILAKCCYLVCRMARPRVVVETGVAYGVSSAFMLRAMEENGSGTLHSIDLSPPTRGARCFRGIAIPDELRGRWSLHPGSSRSLLASLVGEVGPVDVFLHDSLHTRRNMLREFGAIWPGLREGGVVIADDVERNGAFGGLLDRKPALWRVVSDRETEPLHGPEAPITFGLAVK